MEKEVVTHCPRCNNDLIATRLVCRECDLELTGDFGLSKFDYLSADELDLVTTFLKFQGNFKAVQVQRGMSYPAVKKKFSEIVTKLGIEDIEDKKEEVRDIPNVSFVEVELNDSPVIVKIKEKLNACGGRTNMRLFMGDLCEIWFDSNGKGLISPKIPPANQLLWEAFDATVEVVMKNGGKAKKGNAQSGDRLGSGKLMLDTVEGYIAHKVHGVQEGETAFGPGFVICAVLDWAEVCKNERGYLTINPMFLLEGDKK